MSQLALIFDSPCISTLINLYFPPKRKLINNTVRAKPNTVFHACLPAPHRAGIDRFKCLEFLRSVLYATILTGESDGTHLRGKTCRRCRWWLPRATMTCTSVVKWTKEPVCLTLDTRLCRGIIQYNSNQFPKSLELQLNSKSPIINGRIKQIYTDID